ncbi:MAG: DUF3696 domain-containing protein [Sphingobacterium sp.]|jgi:ABC-type cobalamin/Fe3+-siderophores transport system ATPase subunit|nr:DUF3696 domain-containing protein [Sphingobacterium sp.]
MPLIRLSIENYKAFQKKQTIEIKPITLLIGKNSSGKSSIAKLFTLLENSLSGNISEPLLLENNNVSLGGEFRDLAFRRLPTTPIIFTLQFAMCEIEVAVLLEKSDYEVRILNWNYVSDNFNLKLSYSPSSGYTDETGQTYDCEFGGFIPKKMILNGKDLAPSLLSTIPTLDVDYIGPFRILPDRQFHLIGKMEYNKTGVKGEFAYPILGISQFLKKDLHTTVGKWYKENFNGWELKVEASSRPFIEILLEKNDTSVNIVDVGQGMNQALPLVVRANISKQNSIIVLEQPELHLHPAAHADLAELFAKSAVQKKQTFIIETHAENFILRLRKLIVENDFGLTKDDVIIYFVDDCESGGQEINEITINAEGDLSDWPDNVFNENVEEIIQIKNAVRRKKEQQ